MISQLCCQFIATRLRECPQQPVKGKIADTIVNRFSRSDTN